MNNVPLMKYLLTSALLAVVMAGCRGTTEPDQRPYMRASINGVHWEADTATIASTAATGPSCLVIYGYSGNSRSTEHLVMLTLNRDSVKAGGVYQAGVNYTNLPTQPHGSSSDPLASSTVRVNHYTSSWIDGTFEFVSAPRTSTDTLHVTNGEFGVYNK